MLSRLSTNVGQRLILMTSIRSQKTIKCKFSRLAYNIANNSLKNRTTFEALTCSKFSGIIPIRYQSTINTNPAEDLASALPASTIQAIENAVESTNEVLISKIPDIPKIVEPIINLHPNGEATLASIGLGGYSPVGLVQQGLELLHIHYGMPWWEAIVLGTVGIRILLFPISIKMQKTAAHSQRYMPELNKYQQKLSQARLRGDQFEAAQCAHEMNMFMKETNVQPMKPLGLMLFQFPIFISVFFALRRMATTPVVSMKEGGVLWFTDLTVADPYYLLPIITCTTLYLTTEFSILTSTNAGTGNLIKFFLRGASIVTLPIIIKFPTAILCYWCTSNILNFFQTVLFKIPSVRNYLGIPAMSKPVIAPAQKKGFKQGLKESWTNWKIMKKVADKQRADMLQFNKAGTGPITKTFKSDPTKIPP